MPQSKTNKCSTVLNPYAETLQAEEVIDLSADATGAAAPSSVPAKRPRCASRPMSQQSAFSGHVIYPPCVACCWEDRIMRF